MKLQTRFLLIFVAFLIIWGAVRTASELARRNLQKIGFVSAEVSGAIADIDASLSSLKQRGLSERVVYKRTFPKDENEYRTVIQQLRQRQVDAIVVALFPGALRMAMMPSDWSRNRYFKENGQVMK